MSRMITIAALVLAAVGWGPVATAAQESSWDRMSLHGYMTQGYGVAQEPIHGITTDGTSDLRTAALQLRYALSAKDNLVVQARHRRLGDNILSEVQEDVQLEWAFYQRRMGDFSVRVGKVPLPMGLYSETRNVGTLLPFYRAPATVYPDGVESFDGVNVNYDVQLGGWGLELSTSVGSFVLENAFQHEHGEVAVARSRGDIRYAGTVTVNTPMPGLRVRGTVNTFEQPSFYEAGETDLTQYVLGSLEGSFTRLNVRSEYGRIDFGGDMVTEVFYAQGGVHLHPRVTVNTQYEVSRFRMEMMGGQTMRRTTIEDAAVSANFFVSPQVVLKLEGHHAQGYSFDNQGFESPRQQGNYLISSLSVSF